jgi:hypothetical protein
LIVYAQKRARIKIVRFPCGSCASRSAALTIAAGGTLGATG